MAEQSYPFDAGSGFTMSEDQWRTYARNFMKSGVVGTVFTPDGSTPAAARVTAGVGNQIVRAAAPDGAMADGIFWRDESSLTRTVPLNEDANPRIDCTVLRVNPSANTITTEVVTGTPASNPQRPALPRDPIGVWEMPLYQHTMPGSGSPQAPTDFVDLRRWTVPSYGGNVGYGLGLAILPGQTRNEQVSGRQHIPAFAGEVIEVAYSANIRVDGTDYQGISWGVSGIGLEAVSQIPANHYYRQVPRASGAVDWNAYDFRWRYKVLSDFPWVGISVGNRGITPRTRIIVDSTHYQITIL